MGSEMCIRDRLHGGHAADGARASGARARERSGGACGAVSIGYERTVARFAPALGGAGYLAAREFRGLDATPGTHDVQAGVPRGRAGVASAYAAEGATMGATPALAIVELLAQANALNDSAASVEPLHGDARRDAAEAAAPATE